MPSTSEEQEQAGGAGRSQEMGRPSSRTKGSQDPKDCVVGHKHWKKKVLSCYSQVIL